MTHHFDIEIGDGYKLSVDRSCDPNFDREIYIGITAPDGTWHQDLAIVRQAYDIADDLRTEWQPKKFEVLVYSDQNSEDYTHEFKIPLYEGE